MRRLAIGERYRRPACVVVACVALPAACTLERAPSAQDDLDPSLLAQDAGRILHLTPASPHATLPAADAATSDAGSVSSGAPGTQDGGVLHVTAADAGTATMDPAHAGGCEQDANCNRAAPRCDVSAHICVECITHDDCPRVTAAQCGQGHCESCTANEACAHIAGLAVCGLGATAGLCVGCVSNSDCADPATPECDGRACVACTSNAACSSRPGATVCDVARAVTWQDSDEGGDEGKGNGKGKHGGGHSPGTGACVECTGADHSACGERDCDVDHLRCKGGD